MPYTIVAQTDECTVVSKYEPSKKPSGSYQSEAALEKEFIKMFEDQGYDLSAENKHSEYQEV